MTAQKPDGSFVRLALDHPMFSLVVLSFVVMSLVVGIEMIEEGPPVYGWVVRHGRSIALIKQVLCMTAIPGFLILMFWDSKKKSRKQAPAGREPRFMVIALSVVLLATTLYIAYQVAILTP